MPKKIPIIETVKWLEAYEQGASEASIAKRAKRDSRTVKRGIEQARRQREAFHARAEILKDALLGHQRDLLELVAAIHSAIDLSASRVPLVEGDDGQWLPARTKGIVAQYELGTGWHIALEIEDSTVWELTQEHLGRDPLWKALENWRKAFENHLSARSSLKRKAAETLLAKTGFCFGEETSSPPFIVRETAVGLLYQAALNVALGIPTVPRLEDQVVSDTATSEVRTGRNELLAKAPGAEAGCRANMLRASEETLVSPEVGAVQDTNHELVDATDKARRLAEEITLLKLVPGRCRVCRRLGM